MKKKISILTMLVMMSAGIVFATTFTNGVGDNDFNNAGNWDAGLPGTVGGAATINDIAITTADYTKGAFGAFRLNIGALDTGHLTIGPGTFMETGGSVFVGDDAGGNGTLDIFGSIKIAGTGMLCNVGANGGTGYVNVKAGGKLESVKKINIFNGKVSYDANAVSTPNLKDNLVVEAGGTLAFATDGDTVATLHGVTLKVDLFAGSTLELNLGGLFEVGDSWILVDDISSFTQQGTFSNVVSSDGYKIAIDYTAPTMTATLVSATALPVSPAVGHKNIDIATPLAWKAGSLSTVTGYDVYLGTDPCDLPTLLVENQDILTTSPVLENGQTYYWRVDAYELEDGMTEPNLVTGSVWSFTTISASPQVTSGPEAFTFVDGDQDVTLTITSVYADTFQWYKNDVALTNTGNISGADSESITVSSPAQADEGFYYCIASDSTNPGPQDQSPSGRILTKRLVAHFDFEDTLTDAASGLVGTYVDVAGTPLDENTLYTDLGEGSISGKCIDLANDRNHIRVAGGDEYFANCPIGFTLSGFVQIDPGREYGTLMAFQNTDQDEGWRLRCYNQRPEVYINKATDNSAVHPGSISLGQWHMITGTFDGEYIILYVDGVATNVSGVNTNTIDNYSGVTVIGAAKEDGNAWFYGLLDELKVWNYPLGPDAILQEYANTVGKPVCSDTAALQHDLNDDCQVNIDDLVILVNSWLDTSNVVAPNN